MYALSLSAVARLRAVGRRSLSTLCLTAIFALGAFSGCAEKRVIDDQLPQGPCRETGRVDDIIKKEAIAEFQRFGRTCELYNLNVTAENEQETVWRVCCGEAALTYAYYPGKCVARRTSNGLIQCEGGGVLPTPQKTQDDGPMKPAPPPATL